jgi:prenyltransferase beta subunit
VKELIMPPEGDAITEGVLAFLKARWKEDGGYGATPMLPATVEDTYHALRILAARGRKDAPAVSEAFALRNYLARAKAIGELDARTTFHLLSACRLAGIPVDAAAAMAFVGRRHAATKELAERYYCARIGKEILGAPFAPDQAMADALSQISWRDATELWMSLYLLDVNRIARDVSRRRDLVHWLQACQNYDGGFGFLPGTTSFVENCHTCLRALALLRAAPRDPEGCRAFILGCQTATGGFARINGATAFLDSTWHAVAALSLLKSSILNATPQPVTVAER